jgi:hypothetical protein
MNNQSGYIQTRFGDPANRRRIYVGAFIALIIAGVYTGLNELFPEYDGHYGFWSIMPPLVAILLAFWTREVVSALFIGICLGGVFGFFHRHREFCADFTGISVGIGRIDRYLDPNRRC